MKKFLLFAVLAVLVALILTVIQKSNNSFIPLLNTNSSQERQLSNPEITQVILENLEIPWSIAFLPNENFLFTERSGRLNIYDNQTKQSKLISKINVVNPGEGGLHGVEIDPEFNINNFIYLYFTYEDQGNTTLNKVVRYKFTNNMLSNEKIIIDKIPGAPFHDGGRIKFGPDGLLYVTTGDAQEPSLAQNRNSLAGKILRVTRDGNPAPNNPFNTRVFSYGHRNSQGITWDSEGNLWSTEHGRSGALSGLDELNLIESGKNYGWPEIEGNESKSGMETPILNSGPNDTWAPGGITHRKGKLYFTGLRGSALYEYEIETGILNTHFKDEFGRIRDVVVGPDNMLYIAISNRDGRGSPSSSDDRILKINPEKL